MAKLLKGSWVEIERVLLTPEQRAPQAPEDTRKTPYVLKVNGFLDADANVGDEVSVTSAIGRKITGKLVQASPGYSHSFGAVVPELLKIGKEDVA